MRQRPVALPNEYSAARFALFLAPVSAAQTAAEIAFVARCAGDMRDLTPIDGTFDAIINLWQSFGYFDAATNAAVLRQIHAKLRPRGRLILDIYHRRFFAQQSGARAFARAGRTIREHTQMRGDRRICHLDYGPGLPADTFAWQLYTSAEISALAAGSGFGCRVMCSGFVETQPATAATPWMQIVLEKGDAE